VRRRSSGGDAHRAETLIGRNIVNPAGETVGEINELLLAREGNIRLADRNADDRREATTSMTEERLDALPVYEDGATR